MHYKETKLYPCITLQTENVLYILHGDYTKATKIYLFKVPLKLYLQTKQILILALISYTLVLKNKKTMFRFTMNLMVYYNNALLNECNILPTCRC